MGSEEGRMRSRAQNPPSAFVEIKTKVFEVHGLCEKAGESGVCLNTIGHSEFEIIL